LELVKEEYSMYHEELASLMVSKASLEKTPGDHSEELTLLREEIRQRERLQAVCDGSMKVRRQEFEEAERAFSDYDAKYQATKAERRQILSELLALSNAEGASAKDGETPNET
ncbi:MAG: hypothetical protein IJT31_02085, partial [Oscillibacter sp.]|nr:hypothetical protein [Oscillibacter sp.]